MKLNVWRILRRMSPYLPVRLFIRQRRNVHRDYLQHLQHARASGHTDISGISYAKTENTS
ncbi:hypothetical protein ECA0704 [Pectobacterium atrosepticum SCRI1043]|uniref:Uncharacterized protein n=1 Tax=Pectobacterium atrosepticum (strain SCRI 1043 / ATCC BAA-672) TaxID=218491 RepID=Q6D9B3_PECAS|nr:hypothetical protein ECA0704 [Pectobacterium atrosepticum SCRI1043]